MSEIPVIFAKVAALHKVLKDQLNALRNRSYLPYELFEFFSRYEVIRQQLIDKLPELYLDLPVRNSPDGSLTSDQLAPLVADLEYILEVRANSELKSNLVSKDRDPSERPGRVFISHGRSPDWREVQVYIEKDVKFETLELAQEPNKGRTVLQKLDEESNSCSFAVVVMTGDDDIGIGAPRARENVMHEIGYFQGKYGLANVCLLHEEGTNIPSNIHGLVYIPFPKGLVSATFGVLGRELRAAFSKTS